RRSDRDCRGPVPPPRLHGGGGTPRVGFPHPNGVRREGRGTMNTLLSSPHGLPPLLVWGLFPRLLGLVFFLSFASLFRQVVPLAGAGGISPIRPQLEKIRADYPSWRRFLYFPTLLWLRADDWCLRLLCVLGAAGALWALYGGPWSNLGLLLCWACYLSL